MTLIPNSKTTEEFWRHCQAAWQVIEYLDSTAALDDTTAGSVAAYADVCQIIPNLLRIGDELHALSLKIEQESAKNRKKKAYHTWLVDREFRHGSSEIAVLTAFHLQLNRAAELLALLPDPGTRALIGQLRNDMISVLMRSNEDIVREGAKPLPQTASLGLSSELRQ